MTFAFTKETFLTGFLIVTVPALLAMTVLTLKMWGDDHYPEFPLFLRVVIPLLKVLMIIAGVILMFFLLGNLILWLGLGL